MIIIIIIIHLIYYKLFYKIKNNHNIDKKINYAKNILKSIYKNDFNGGTKQNLSIILNYICLFKIFIKKYIIKTFIYKQLCLFKYKIYSIN